MLHLRARTFAPLTKIALNLPNPFDNYLFIEKSPKRARELQAVIKSEFPQLLMRCHFHRGDANAKLREWCAERDWLKERAVVFPDPFGMQVNWQTVEILAATKGIDLWYLFPGIARLLRRDGNIPEATKKRLDSLLGTNDWRTRFYHTERRTGFFTEIENIERTATETAIGNFIHERLEACFGKKR